ncbi:MAG: TonB family protein [Luteitalea sp.]|nr:TonB family protein [Luteitalea sp.]
MELYSPGEIARAAGVSTGQARAAFGGRDCLVPHDEAVRVGRQLIDSQRTPFAMFMAPPTWRPRGLPIAVSSTLHAGIVAATVIIAAGLTPRAATFEMPDHRADDMRLIFLAGPGPGGGGGGGGLRQRTPPPQALREGRGSLSSPLPARRPPKPIEPVSTPAEPTLSPIASEALPVVVAPIVGAPADIRDRAGVLEQARADVESRGPGRDGGAGTGAGTGLGDGDGSGVGAGSEGGTGGGPFRPGSGVAPPRLLREVKGDYTDEARRAGISGDVVLEIVVRRDGSVGDVRVLQGLPSGLNERAIQAVRKWHFAPATRQGIAVEVVVEVAMEFRLR